MAQLAAGRVLVGTPSGHVLIRVEGRGTHMNSQPLRDFVLEMVRRGFIEFDLDLTECLYVDSTFAGVIVALSLQVRETSGRVALFGANVRCREQLHTLGVDHLFELAQEGTRPPFDPLQAPQMETLPWPYRTREAWADTILESHETLAKIDPHNAERLQDVIEYMAEQKPHRLN